MTLAELTIAAALVVAAVELFKLSARTVKEDRPLAAAWAILGILVLVVIVFLAIVPEAPK